MEHFENCPARLPIVVRAESKTLAAVLMMAMMYDRAIHVCALSRREEIMVVKEAKRRGAKVTCGVSPTHLFLTDDEIDKRGEDIMSIRPRLATEKDKQSLWDNIDIIDVFSSHHAPHTKEEKQTQKLPGFPGIQSQTVSATAYQNKKTLILIFKKKNLCARARDYASTAPHRRQRRAPHHG